ncbi:ankyrin repeat-containing domain protein [Boletus reticuloceps]|uniref:Ankyrin repeat-containing domain protein n=1 Tax=Boletus reticuloceps TaxID=495285 RepID=A0A8I3AFL5_9AGAM|nr:ankyrin repeat-containing domain protein [Boletus reticuloceps]
MAVDDEQRKLLNRQLLAAARQQGNVEELLISEEYRDQDDQDSFLFDINCTDLSGNTPLHLTVSSGSIEHVNLLIEADGCDVDPQNNSGDTPLHLAVRIPDRATRHAIVSALVETAGAIDSIRLANKAGQTPNDLAKIYCPNDTEVVSLTMPPARQVNDILGYDDIASGGEGEESD